MFQSAFPQLLAELPGRSQKGFHEPITPWEGGPFFGLENWWTSFGPKKWKNARNETETILVYIFGGRFLPENIRVQDLTTPWQRPPVFRCSNRLWHQPGSLRWFLDCSDLLWSFTQVNHHEIKVKPINLQEQGYKTNINQPFQQFSVLSKFLVDVVQVAHRIFVAGASHDLHLANDKTPEDQSPQRRGEYCTLCVYIYIHIYEYIYIYICIHIYRYIYI